MDDSSGSILGADRSDAFQWLYDPRRRLALHQEQNGRLLLSYGCFDITQTEALAGRFRECASISAFPRRFAMKKQIVRLDKSPRVGFNSRNAKSPVYNGIQ